MKCVWVTTLIFAVATAKTIITVKENRGELPPTCDSLIFCRGELLRVVQMAQVFPDSKTFVDMSIKSTVEETLNNFRTLMLETNHNPTKKQIEDFVFDNFESGSELEEWTPPDFNAEPAFLKHIADQDVRSFASELVGLWPHLGRRVRDEVAEHPEHYSIIPVPNGVIVPGGRFLEFYYWDSYWVIKGLLISEMPATVRGMIDNFISMVKTYGFVPNGGRVYYTQRSQPPLLTKMATAYVNRTQDLTWLAQNIQYLAEELNFWLIHRTVTFRKGGQYYTLATYKAESLGPRPESYLEDVRTAAFADDPEEQQEIYSDLKSAAQSGWDFSRRWIFDDEGGINANLSYIETRRVIPVDLNAFLYGAFKDISQLYLLLKDQNAAEIWSEKALAWRRAIQNVLWNERDGIWYDFDLELNQQRQYYFASNVAPLWTGAYDETQSAKFGRAVADYLIKMGIPNHRGGIPTSLIYSGEQWDLPNAWPPLQAIVIQGLENTGDVEAKRLAREFAQNWVEANMIGFKETGAMFEKYDTETPGRYGGGGEYEVQFGFGWTNGVALEFIVQYFS